MSEKLKEISDFLNEVKKIRVIDIDKLNDPLFMYSDWPYLEMNDFYSDIIKVRIHSLGRKFPNLDGPEKSYMESLCNYYNVNPDFSRNLPGDELKYLKTPISALELPTRINTILLNNNVTKLIELTQKKEQELLEMEGFSKASLNHVRQALHPLGLYLGMVFEYKKDE